MKFFILQNAQETGGLKKIGEIEFYGTYEQVLNDFSMPIEKVRDLFAGS
jgi:hypothetical protein